ncbi:MAG: helix-turn-helix domain-containing protein [Cellulomonadaceae bacterium]
MDTVMLAERIRQERERAGLSQTDLASKAGLERTAVTKIETGTRRVTALEVNRLAAAIGVRMARLFEEPIPAIVSHRSSQGLDTTESRIDEILVSLANEVEFIQRLAPERMSPEFTLDEIAHPSTPAEAESLAAHTRERLGFAPDEPVYHLPKVVARLGLWAFADDIGADTADAGTVLLRKGAVTFINSCNKVGRRRLALAHEFGHFLVQDDYTVDWRVTHAGGDIESRLDRFARAFLLPETGLRKHWVRCSHLDVREAAVVTASAFQVDMTTLARRLGELQIDADTSAIRETRTTAADIIEHGLNVPFDLEGTFLPPQYQRAVLALYRESRLSVERTLELLRGSVPEGDLPTRPRRTEGEIWNFVS